MYCINLNPVRDFPFMTCSLPWWGMDGETGREDKWRRESRVSIVVYLFDGVEEGLSTKRQF